MHTTNTAEEMPMAMRRLYKTIVAMRVLKTQKVTTRSLTRLTVTTCLYLSPNNKARSLSTLTAVVVNSDTAHSIDPKVLKSNDE